MRSEPPDADREALDALEAVHCDVERLEALAHVVAEMMQDARLPPGEASRRFSRLVGTLADACEETRTDIAAAIERLTKRQ